MKLQTINVIHHLSSSGGTLISKCLAAMPDVVLLSEVHPLAADRIAFFPIDPFGQFAVSYPELLPDEAEMFQKFRDRVLDVAAQCAIKGRSLILRDHTHSDYLTDREPKGRVVAAIEPVFRLNRVVTIRNPIDAWLSMKVSSFDAHLTGFDDYCTRTLRFLEDHAGLHVWRYEDFVERPDDVLREMCEAFEISFDPSYAGRFNDIVLTGDSGRKPASISTLPRRDVPEGLLEEAASLPAYREISKRFCYD